MDQFMLDAQLRGSFLKKGLNIPLTVGKTVCKFKAVVGLDTFHTNTSAGIPLHQPLQFVRLQFQRWLYPALNLHSISISPVLVVLCSER
ncbi:hypothetical protein AALA54_03505 [Oscillospiraceae bacterium 44-34]